MSPFSFLCSTFAALPLHPSASVLTKSATQFRICISNQPLLKPDEDIEDHLLKEDSYLGHISESKMYNLYELCAMLEACKLQPSIWPKQAAMEYLFHSLKDVDDVNPAGFQYDCSVKSWEQLTPFIATSVQMPDVSVADTSGDCILTAEVHSGKGIRAFEGTACKVVIGLVTQLRQLRTKSDIQSVVGFAFPNFEERTCVVMVTVGFVPFYFQYSFKILQKDEVCKAVKKAFKQNRHPLTEDKPMDNLNLGFPIRLSKDELARIERELRLAMEKQLDGGADKQLQSEAKRPKSEPKSLEQIDSVTSIILKDPKRGKIYKHNHDESKMLIAENVRLTARESINQEDSERSNWLMQLLLLEKTICLDGISFHVFPVITPPLTHAQAQRCLGPLIESTAKAIESLHKLGFAHNDIRLENICFRSGNAVLIDFDHARHAEATSVPEYSADGHTVSCMYKRRTKAVKTAAQYDWMQLGWMAFWLHYLESMRKEDVNYHTMDHVWEKLPTCDFLKQAVNGGVYSKDSLLSSPVYTEHQESLLYVLYPSDDDA